MKPWPRAYLTRDIHVADGPKALSELQKIANYPFGVSPPAVVTSDFGGGYSNEDEEVSQPVSLFQSPDVQVWRLPATSKALFVHNEVLAPGWQAYVDAKPAQIHLANAIFRGVAVPAGAHQIALVYNSQTLRFGLFLALCGLTLAAFCAASRRF